LAALIPYSEALRLDAELVRLARGASAWRLAVGEALDVLSSTGGHHELGFSSLEAYARERCARTGRWAADTRALARRLQSLPRLREEVRSGVIGWSTAELLARHVTVDSELEWLERARRTTVRELRTLLASSDVEKQDEGESTCTLTVTATREDGWMLECARKAAESVIGPMSAAGLLQCLLAEGYSTLLELVPDAAGSGLYDIEAEELDIVSHARMQTAWCRERERWQREAEELCESHGLPPVFNPPAARSTMPIACSSSEGPEVLDRSIRNWCSELSERDLALGIIAESARKADVWRRLGFASESQYARERVGVSLSSLKSKRLLAARTARVPELASALASGRIGYEAAYLLSRVVTAPTVEEWLRRAERRTVKHLREEVEAAELLIRLGQGRDQRPLDERSLDELFEFERCIVSGDWVEGRSGGQMSGIVSTRERSRRFGRVTLRWVVEESTRSFFLALERVFGRVSARVCRVPASFLRFLCENFCRTWLPALRRARCTESGEQPAYFAVYRRDVFRCSSPVCTRRDLTPHHLVFRSRGGGDDDENVASLCVWCHLHGIHEGRILAEPPASKIHWRIGRNGTLSVDGRTLLAS
jgi:hypothetical protein